MAEFKDILVETPVAVTETSVEHHLILTTREAQALRTLLGGGMAANQAFDKDFKSMWSVLKNNFSRLDDITIVEICVIK